MKARHVVLALLVLLSVITYLDRICIGVAAKDIQADLNLSESQWGWVLGAFLLAYGLFEIPSGALGDRIGQRKVLTRIVLWWSAFTALTPPSSVMRRLRRVGPRPGMSSSADFVIRLPRSWRW